MTTDHVTEALECPVHATARIVCAKWTLLVLRDLADGPCRFTELERSLAGISPRTLSQRLRALEDEGVVEREVFAEAPARVEYKLTPKGRDLAPIVEAMRVWGQLYADTECVKAATVAPPPLAVPAPIT